MLAKKIVYLSLVLAVLFSSSLSVNASPLLNLQPSQPKTQVRSLSINSKNTIRLVVVIVNPIHTETLSVTNEEVQDIIFGKVDSLKTFYKENSEGVIDVVGDVVGPVQISHVIISGVSDPGIINEIDPYVNFKNYDHVLIISTQSGACGGYASGYGPQDTVTDDGVLNLAVAVANSGQCVKDFRDKTKVNSILHEFGHTLGLGHTAAWLPNPNIKCSNTIPLDDIVGNVSCFSPYGGGTVMGTANLDLNNAQRSKLINSFGDGLIQLPSLTINENGDYSVRWFKDNVGRSSYEELKIPAGNGYFSVEFRKNIPPLIDQGKIFINFVSNVQLAAIPGGNYMDTILVRAPAFSLQNINDTYSDPTRNFSVRVLQMEENQALLRIQVQ